MLDASEGYHSDLQISVHNLGEGRFILNTLKIGENLQDQFTFRDGALMRSTFSTDPDRPQVLCRNELGGS